MENIHRVSATSEFIGKTVNVHSVAAEIIWRVKRRNHAKFKGFFCHRNLAGASSLKIEIVDSAARFHKN